MINEQRIQLFTREFNTPGADRQFIIRRVFDEMGVPGLEALATRLHIHGIATKHGFHATATWCLADYAGINVRVERALYGSLHTRKHRLNQRFAKDAY